MNLYQKIKNKILKPRMEQVVIGLIAEDQKTLHTYLVALARLSFIKPEVLAREIKNVQANAEYLYKMLEELEKEKENVKN
jgi:hypothetical protein